MRNKVIWFERKFDFDLPAKMFPMVVERLRGAPTRLEEKIRSLSAEMLTRRDAESWTIQEHAGHLVDLEPLWSRRIDDFLEDRERLHPADLTNRKTHEAGHNKTAIEMILNDFRAARKHLVERFEDFTIEDASKTALHPRLDQPMRIIDCAFFIAEHDDHHLARMTDLIRMFG